MTLTVGDFVKRTRFAVAMAYSIEELEAKVQAACREGFTPVGGLCRTTLNSSVEKWYQSLIMEVEIPAVVLWVCAFCHQPHGESMRSCTKCRHCGHDSFYTGRFPDPSALKAKMGPSKYDAKKHQEMYP